MGKNSQAKHQRKYLFRLFLKGSKAYRPLIVLSTVSMVISGVLADVLYPFFVSKILVDISHGDVKDFKEYIPYIVLIIAGEVVGLSFRRFAGFFEERFDAKSRLSICKIVFSKLLDQSASFHQSKFVGTTVTLISKTADCFGRTSAIWIYQVVPMLVVFLGTGVLLIPRVPVYFFCMVVVAGTFIGLVITVLPAQLRLASDASGEVTRMYGAMSDAISNIAAVKAESGEEKEREKIDAIGVSILDKNMKYSKRAIIRDPFISNSVNRSLRVLSVVVALIVAQGSTRDISNIYLATTLTLTFLSTLWMFADQLAEITLYYGDAAPLVPMLEAELVIKDTRGAAELPSVRGNIQIENVSFRYPKVDTAVFTDLSLDIPAGQRVGIVGKSGAGKSTLVKLLLRFADSTSGDILIDGNPIRSITQESLRTNIAYVAQEPMLFHRSVLQNITYGADDATEEQIHEVLTRAHAHEFIGSLPQGIDSIVGERGVNLSGGQRQRIAIARAMLKNAPILILDEATSALDSESEGYVQEAFAELMHGRTTIVIAHRLSTLLNMDRIIVLEHGEVVEDGSHAELVEAGGVYGSLWEHQAGGFLPES